MKKTIALALAALMLLALLTACAAKPAETKPTESGDSDAAETPEQTSTPETTETAPTEEETPAEPEQPAEPALPDGVYTAELTFAGGSGKAQVLSPCTLTVQDGAATAAIVWSSSKYDYMLVNGERYDVLSTEPGSTFEIPVEAFDTDLTVIGDTTAMSTPHEIEYTLNFSSASLQAAGE